MKGDGVRMGCHIHHLKHVAVWIDGHCFMLQRCSGCRRFAVGFTYTEEEPFRNSTNIDVDQVPVEKLRELRTYVSRIPKETKEPEGVVTFAV